MRQTFLSSNWTFTCLDPEPDYSRTSVQSIGSLPATAPGHIHSDLVDNGVIGDPFLRLNEIGSQWIDEANWSYRTQFAWTPTSGLSTRVLLFEGLDTVCKIFLNGNLIGSHDNMFVPLEVDVSALLRDGENELRVDFESAINVGLARRKDYFESEGIAWDTKQFDERAFVRKAQYMSGWDWGPRLVSCGIWRPVSLLEFAARVKSFTVHQAPAESGSYRVWTETEVEGSGRIALGFDDHVVESDASDLVELDLIIKDPVLWWPQGMGEQHLYPAFASLEGSRIDKKIGLRTIELSREPDKFGESFTFLANGVEVWARGANWIPNDSFPSRVTDEDYRAQIQDCRRLGMNMLRVWGGGLYELAPFYDACDELGILVWQDFAYACSYYPDDSAFLEIARAEAEIQIRRLRDRTSLALWCGNNENDMMWESKWGGAQSPTRYYGSAIYETVLPELLAQLDPRRSYISSSPTGKASDGSGDVNGGKYGDSHYWDVWHGRGDWIHYRDSDTRFSSEFGFASACSNALWDKVLSPKDRAKDGVVVRWHDKTGKGWEKYHGYVIAHYPEPDTLEDWTYYSQLNQRDALRFGIEHWRRQDYCKGALIWQFNDCWPVQSWAVQDYLRLVKPAGYELKRLYSDRLISLVRTEKGVDAFVINDSSESWTTDLTLDFYSTVTGEKLDTATSSVTTGPRSRSSATSLAIRGDNLLARATAMSGLDGVQASLLLDEPKNMEFGHPEIFVSAESGRLRLAVSSVAVDLIAWDPDDASNLVPLGTKLPGISANTLVSESVYYEYRRLPQRVCLRALGWEATIAVGQEMNSKLVEIK